jgi:hypothetical protein
MNKVMRYYQTWSDYSRRPEVQSLIESKGMEYVRQQYMREVNYMQWNYPTQINESTSPGGAVNNAINADGSSTQFITGYSKETSTFTLANGLADGFEDAIHGTFFDVYAYNNTVDYSLDHADSVKQIRCFITTGSAETFSNTGGAACVITASVDGVSGIVTGSILESFRDAINNQGASAVVAGFTNTFAPSDIISGSVTDNVLTITREYNAGVPDISLTAGSNTINLSDTASVATPVNGLDTYYYAQGMQVFDGAVAPYSTLPRK